MRRAPTRSSATPGPGLRRARSVAALAALLALAAPAAAAPGDRAPEDRATLPPRGTLRGTVRVSRPGVREPVRSPQSILVYVVGFTEPPPDDAAVIMQREKRFLPSLIGITAGQRVAFPNGDPFYHNVFSPSPARKFDLGQYRPGETRSRLFPSPGVVDVYCNIHPQMSATVLVLPNRRFATVEPDGSFTIYGIPVGRWKAYAYSRRTERPVGADVDIQPGHTTEVDFRITETRTEAPHRNKYGERYRDPERYR